MHPNRFKAVLFDMDETLIRHRVQGLEVAQQTFREFAHRLDPLDETAFLRTVFEKANDLWYMMFDGVIGGDIARPYTFINALRAHQADESIAHSMLEAFEQRLVESTELMDNAHEVMDTLRARGICVGIVTNGFTAMQRRKLDFHELPLHADFVFVSEEVGYHKPHPEIFRRAAAEAGTEAHEALFIGDNLDADIAGAVSAGMPCALMDPAGESRAKLAADLALPRPTHVIEQLNEIYALVGAEIAALKRA